MPKEMQIGDIPDSITDPVFKTFLQAIKKRIESSNRYIPSNGKIYLGDDEDAVIYYNQDTRTIVIDPNTHDGGELVVLGNIRQKEFQRQEVIYPGNVLKGSSAPDDVIVGTAAGLRFNTDAEKVYITYEIPTDMLLTSDLPLHLDIHWTPETALAGTETVIFNITYRCVSRGGTVDGGSTTVKIGTHTQSGAGAANEHNDIDIIIPYDDANNPIKHEYTLFIEFNRDMTTDTFAGDVFVVKWSLHFPANTLFQHNSEHLLD